MRPVETQHEETYSGKLARQFEHVSALYCDYNASTPLSEKLIGVATDSFRHHWLNPSAAYFEANREAELLEKLKRVFSRFISTRSGSVVICASATEAINQAISSLSYNLAPNSELFISDFEHPAVRLAAKHWFGNRVVEISGRRLASDDLSEIKKFSERISLGALFIQGANNETGVILPVERIREELSDALILVDGSQSFGKDENFINQFSAADAVVVSPHKFYGPKGIGVLVWSQILGPLKTLIHGGGQQNGLRSGTENVPVLAIVRHWLDELEELIDGFQEIEKFRDEFEKVLARELSDVKVLGGDLSRLTNTSAILVPGILADSAVAALSTVGIMCSSGSACHAGTTEPSPVFRNFAGNWDDARSVLRFSFGLANLRTSGFELGMMVVKCLRRLQET